MEKQEITKITLSSSSCVTRFKIGSIPQEWTFLRISFNHEYIVYVYVYMYVYVDTYVDVCVEKIGLEESLGEGNLVEVFGVQEINLGHSCFKCP